MRRFIVLFLGMVIWHQGSLSQKSFLLSGRVEDEFGKPLPGATVVLYPANKGAATDVDGHFVFMGLPHGPVVLAVAFIGYQTSSDTLVITKDQTFEVLLKPASLSLQEVLVTDQYVARRKREQTLNTQMVDGEYLKQNLGGSLMSSLGRLGGVSTIDIGSGQSKPIIRGLGFNQVVVVENNIKHEAQQWGSDHGLEIDQYAVDDVEVVKGPASLMYGSDAIGGVINLQNRRVPSSYTMGGSVDLTGKSNNGFLGSSVALFGRRDRFFADVRATVVGYGDYRVPASSVDIYSYRAPLHKRHLRNTAGREQNFHFSVGYLDERFQNRLFFSHVGSKSGFFANAHGLEPLQVDTELHDRSSRDINDPYQQVSHLKVIDKIQYHGDGVKLESDLGFQRNFRQEWSPYVSHGYIPAVFPDTMGFDARLERLFEKYVYSGNVRLSIDLDERINLKSGLNTEYQENRIDGRGFIIPAYHQLTAGGFLLGHVDLSAKSLLQIGIRYDYGHIRTQAYQDWFPSPVTEEDGLKHQEYLVRALALNRSVNNFSWSLGYAHHGQQWSFKTNVGKGFRMPIAKELAANGVNYHYFRYEVGNGTLSPEVSYQLDAGVTYKSKMFGLEFTPFVNYFSNYIYLNPTPDHDRQYGNGNQVFRYTQSRVFRYGAEIQAQYQLNREFQFGLVGEWVYSEQLSGEKKGFTLPFSPAPSAILSLKYQNERVAFWDQPYFTVDVRFTAAQHHVVPPEESTPGSQIVNLGLGSAVDLRGHKVNFNFQVINLLNTKYFNHTSFYRLINVPEAGRNFVLNISIPFSGSFKNKQI